MSEQRSAIERHYEASLGQPYDLGQDFVSTSKGTLSVLYWGPSLDWGVHVHATVGAFQWNRLSDCAVEYYVGLDQRHDEISGVLADLSAENFGRDGPPSIGDTIEMRMPLWGQSEMTVLMIVDVGATHFPSLVLPEFHVNFRKLIPLFARELDFKKSEGYEVLIDRFEKAGTEYWCCGRAPAI